MKIYRFYGKCSGGNLVTGSETVKRNCTITRQRKSSLNLSLLYQKMVGRDGKGVERSYEKAKWVGKHYFPFQSQYCRVPGLLAGC